MLRLAVFSILFLNCGATLDLFSTFNNIGITKTTSNSQCNTVEYCQGSECQPGHPLSLVTRHGYFVGSVLWLDPGTEYTIKVDCEGDYEEGTIRTQDELVEHTTPTKTLFVSPSGTTDPVVGDECSSNQPCDISIIDDLLEPGTHVLFEDGYYKFGDLYIRNGGTLENPVVFKRENENGEVIVDGSATVANSEFTKNGNLYEADIDVGTNKMRFMAIVNKNTKIAKRLLRYHDITQLQDMFYENIGYHAVEDATQISINIGELNLDDYDVVYTAHSFAFSFYDADYFHVFGFHFKFFGNYYNVRFSGASRCWLKDNIFEHCYRCVGLSGLSEHNVIDENEFYDSMYEMSDAEYPSPGWDGVKAAGSMEAGGVTIFSTGEEQLSGRGLVIRNNVWHDWFDSFNCASSSNELTTVTNEVDVYGNYIYDNSDDGFQIDGDSSNVRVYNNFIENILSGISGPVYIVNNVLLDCHGVCYKFNVDDPRQTGEVFMYHNVAISKMDSTSSNMNIAGHFWQKATSRNNILLSSHYCWTVSPDDDQTDTVDLDYDACYTNSSDYNLIMKWETSVETLRWETLEEIQTNTGQEMNGIHITDDEVMKNLFKGTGTFASRFELSENTVLTGKGVSIPGINNGVTNPDIGLLFTFEVPIDDPGNGNERQVNVGVIVGVALGIVFLILCVSFVVIVLIIILVIAKSRKNREMDTKMDDFE